MPDERKSIAQYRDDTVIFKGFVKYKSNANNEIIYDYYKPNEVPQGYYHRKEYEYYYQPNVTTLISFLRHKTHDKTFGLGSSFCVWAQHKIDATKDYSDNIDKVKDIYITDVDKVKALPNLAELRVPDRLHQKITSYWAYNLPHSCILNEQGLGKTKTAIDTYDYKKSKHIVNRCLIIAPLSVMGSEGWPKQIEEYSHNPSSIIVRGTKDEKIKILNGDNGDYDFYIINYEGLANIIDEIVAWVDNSCMVVLDESSKIKNYASKRAKNCIAIGKRTSQKNIMSGTPITQNAHDIFAPFLFLDGGDTFGTSYEKFLETYFFRDGWSWGINKFELKRINKKIFEKGVRFTKREATDLPEKTYTTRECDMTDIQREYYKTILQQELIRLSELEVVDAQNILVTIMRLQQIADGFIATKNDETGEAIETKAIAGPNAKIALLEEILEELGDSQVVIWSRFRFMHKQIKEMLDRKKISNVVYTGGISREMKDIAEANFKAGKSQVFISNPQAGGYGMNLQNASYAIYIDNSYSLQDREQSEDRIHRIGMGDKAVYIDILCAPIDKLVKNVLAGKKSIANIVTGDIERLKRFFEEGLIVTGNEIILRRGDVKEAEEQLELSAPLLKLEYHVDQNPLVWEGARE